MNITKQEMKSLQGICVMAMVLLHLFDRLSYVYTPVLFLGSLPLCYFFGLMGDFCVMGYAFCSGYAHSIRYHIDGNQYYHRRLKGLLKLMINYWLILILFSIIGIISGNTDSIPTSFPVFLKNFLFISHSFNGTWWYITTYIFIVLTSPIIINAIKKHPYISGMFFAILYFVSYILRFKIQPSNWFIIQLYLYGMTVSEYAIGIYFWKYNAFNALSSIWKKVNSKWSVITLCVLFLIFSYFRCLYMQTLFIAPICGCIIISMHHIFYNCNPIFKAIEFIGNHSTNIWLTHFFFFGTLFKDFIFIAKYPLIIFVFIMILTLILSAGINYPLKKIYRLCKL